MFHLDYDFKFEKYPFVGGSDATQPEEEELADLLDNDAQQQQKSGPPVLTIGELTNSNFSSYSLFVTVLVLI